MMLKHGGCIYPAIRIKVEEYRNNVGQSLLLYFFRSTEAKYRCTYKQRIIDIEETDPLGSKAREAKKLFVEYRILSPSGCILTH